MSNRFFQVDAYPGSEIISASVVGALSINGSSGDYAITTQDITNAGSGLTFGGIGAEAGASLGYEPFASAADAEAAITQLIGVYTFQTPG